MENPFRDGGAIDLQKVTRQAASACCSMPMLLLLLQLRVHVSQHVVPAGWTCLLTDSVVRASPIQNPFGADGFFGGGAQQKKEADGKGSKGGGIFGATWQ